jgi:orotidine-5'-phosphate decarboxylase
MPKVFSNSTGRLLDATADLVCAYKPNFAFYEAFGTQGFAALKETVDYIPKDIPVIGDAKRGDIGKYRQSLCQIDIRYF